MQPDIICLSREKLAINIHFLCQQIAEETITVLIRSTVSSVKSQMFVAGVVEHVATFLG